ncbi:MAG: efflux RND transporter periplasmic adaptor subunit [Hyphomicrobiaceae bacterium]
MKTKILVVGLITLALGGAFAVAKGKLNVGEIIGAQKPEKETIVAVRAPSVSVAKVTTTNFIETAFVTGSLVARDEILVAPEVEGLRILTVNVDEGDRVEKGQVLANLRQDTLQAQLAQNDAALARSKAAIEQAKSQLNEANARLTEAMAQLQRAKPLKKRGYLSAATYDQRNATMQTAKAQVTAAKDGIGVAKADLAQQKALRRDITWRLERTVIRAPEAGLVSRRTARIGAVATSVAEPMFRIIQAGEIELEGEVTETELAKVKPGLNAYIDVAGVGKIEGTVRYVSPEVSRDTRLGHVRISLEQNPGLKIGAFARGTIKTDGNRGMAIPMAAVMYSANAKHVLRVDGNKVKQQTITTGLQSGILVEIRSGLKEGELVVSKAGTFLRDGDLITPVLPNPKLSQAQ